MAPSQIPLALFLWLLGQPGLVAAIVNYLKKNPFVMAHPKLVATLLNALGIIVADLLFGKLPGNILDAVTAFLTLLAQSFASTGFYEYTKGAIKITVPPQ